MPTKKNKPQLPEPEIFQMIRNEHKYTQLLLGVLKEQLAEFDIGKCPDYNLMQDIANYINSYPEKFDHPAKIQLISNIIERDPSNSANLETLLAEKKQVTAALREVLKALKSLVKEDTILKEEQLKIFCKNYVELVDSQIEVEKQLVFSRARSLFSQEELEAYNITNQSIPGHEDHPDFEQRYKSLADKLNQRWEEVEVAANEFALAEFIGMSAFFESLEPLTIGIQDMSSIVKEVSYKMFMEQYQCYKSLLTTPQTSPADYWVKPIDCMKLCYQEYQSGIEQIIGSLNKTRHSFLEPYESKIKYFRTRKKADVKQQTELNGSKTKKGLRNAAK